MPYKNPPIYEAVFDVRIAKIGVQSVEALREFKKHVQDDYQNERKTVNFSGTFQADPNNNLEAKPQSNVTGFVYATAQNNKQFQVRLDGFTLNVLKPYQGWEIHFEEFIKGWELYRKLFSPSSVQRIATRFINRIEIPLSFKDFNDYIVNMPPIPNGLPQLFSSFFMQIQVPCDSDNLRNTILTETMEAPTDKVLPFILDVDVFQDSKLSFDNLVDNFHELRKIKNQVFENCITDQARQLFA